MFSRWITIVLAFCIKPAFLVLLSLIPRHIHVHCSKLELLFFPACLQVDPEMRVRFTSPHPKDFPDEVNCNHNTLCMYMYIVYIVVWYVSFEQLYTDFQLYTGTFAVSGMYMYIHDFLPCT